jgi:anti-sigma B factor antagonist
VDGFSIELGTDAEGRQVVWPHGELDLASHGQLLHVLEDLLADDGVDIVVDLRHTTFLDSTALGTLVSARHRAIEHDGSLSLVCGNPRLLRIFEVTGLDQAFEIRDA